MSEFRLTTEIVARSASKVWDAAKLEWVLHEVYEADTPESCLCGHYPIIELCVLRNRLNNDCATVGNCCVKKFIGLPSDLIFLATKRIRSDSSRSLNAEALLHALEKGWINEWEYNFYLRIMRKRNLSAKQSAKKVQINQKFLNNMKRVPKTRM